VKVKYHDGPAAVTIPQVSERVERGQLVEVPTEVGKQLIEQGWVGEGAQKPSDAARKLAAEAGLEISSVQGSGKGGAVTVEDVEQAIEARDAAENTADGAEPAADSEEAH